MRAARGGWTDGGRIRRAVAVGLLGSALLVLGPFAPSAHADGPVTQALTPVRQVVNTALPTTCSVVYQQLPTLYPPCHQTLNSLSLNGNNVRYWLFEGCYVYETPDPTYAGPLGLGICPTNL